MPGGRRLRPNNLMKLTKSLVAVMTMTLAAIIVISHLNVTVGYNANGTTTFASTGGGGGASLPSNCAGVNTATTGTISSGSPSLVVASATGWSVGMGIAVHNAGTGGTTELITTVDNIAGTTFTLHTNAL